MNRIFQVTVFLVVLIYFALLVYYVHNYEPIRVQPQPQFDPYKSQPHKMNSL